MTAADALNATLAVEHEALYAYAVIGAHANTAAAPLARSAYDAHQGWRDRLSTLVTDAGGQPVPPEAAYKIALPVVDNAGALTLAATVEDGCAVAYEQLVVAAEEPALRSTAAAGLIECATRATRWRLLAGQRQTAAFPGRG
ncbi:MAG: hypothetical protein QOC60_1361 [Frankiaceae bacterium]|nr:hypothetical protein [Frankiaceae bacterium]